ncbi:unnamed protein product [Ilex paraguariensis]|uniref:Uncharacterized protein n=1 Tax=Ilex paraguariensis TaxID=185542 RepID=A0ABC8RH99_9AQUA
MNMSASECSSGCESGWTMYLDQFSNSAEQCHRVGEDCRSKGENVDEEEEDEDLSMVSDASSGPPHVNEDCFDGTGFFGFASSDSEQVNKNKQKNRVEHGGKPQNSYLDDTANSHFLSFSKASPMKTELLLKNRGFPNNEASLQHVQGVSQGVSETKFKGKSAIKRQFGFLQPLKPGKAASEKSGGLQGRK